MPDKTEAWRTSCSACTFGLASARAPGLVDSPRRVLCHARLHTVTVVAKTRAESVPRIRFHKRDWGFRVCSHREMALAEQRRAWQAMRRDRHCRPALAEGEDATLWLAASACAVEADQRRWDHLFMGKGGAKASNVGVVRAKLRPRKVWLLKTGILSVCHDATRSISSFAGIKPLDGMCLQELEAGGRWEAGGVVR